MTDKGKNWYQRLLHIEPGISLGQWVYDTIAANWSLLVATFVAGGGMTYLSAITDWTSHLGPAGIGGIGLFAALVTHLFLAWAKSKRADARNKHAASDAMRKWQQQVDSVNPLDAEFHKKRINLNEIAHPITRRIKDKKFYDCEFIGPTIILAYQNNTINANMVANCDFCST